MERETKPKYKIKIIKTSIGWRGILYQKMRCFYLPIGRKESVYGYEYSLRDTIINWIISFNIKKKDIKGLKEFGQRPQYMK